VSKLQHSANLKVSFNTAADPHAKLQTPEPRVGFPTLPPQPTEVAPFKPATRLMPRTGPRHEEEWPLRSFARTATTRL
jgi:hypothetical protein